MKNLKRSPSRLKLTIKVPFALFAQNLVTLQRIVIRWSNNLTSGAIVARVLVS